MRLRGRADDEAVTIGLVGVRGLGDAAVLLTLTGSADDPALKQTMAQATKMQAVGQLAGGIAHDFNNILTAILGNCDLMLLRHTPGDSDYDDIQHIRSNSNRAANLTRQLLAFSRQQTLRPQILNLSDIVADVSHLLERLLGDNVTLTVQHGRGLGPVRADPVQLEQVIVNLAVNARDAMPRGGTLTISTSAVAPADVHGEPDDVVPPGDYSLLTVEDTGSGIPPDILPKIFDPFFTTKDVGKGTGLGLATVYGIVKQSGGYITADSLPGEGTRFSIYLPVHRGAAEADPRRDAAQPAARGVHWGSGTILLVEDEDMVRAVAERAMVRAGYTVISARQGEEGLEKFAATADIDLVVSDVMMPQMDGRRWSPKSVVSAPSCRSCSCQAMPRNNCASRLRCPTSPSSPNPFPSRNWSKRWVPSKRHRVKPCRRSDGHQPSVATLSSFSTTVTRLRHCFAVLAMTKVLVINLMVSRSRLVPWQFRFSSCSRSASALLPRTPSGRCSRRGALWPGWRTRGGLAGSRPSMLRCSARLR